MNTQSTYCGAGSGWSLFTDHLCHVSNCCLITFLLFIFLILGCHLFEQLRQKNQINVDKKNNST